MQMQRPQYRTLRWGPVGVVIYDAGKIVQHDGWPTDALEPVNEAARRIFSYWRENRLNPWLAKTPWNELRGNFYLPPLHLSGWGNSKRHAPVAASGTPNAPVYEYVGSMRREFGIEIVQPGAHVAFLGWPSAELKPVNGLAKRVAEYFERYTAHPQFPPAPYCLFIGDVSLPELPTRGTARIIEREQTRRRQGIASGGSRGARRRVVA